MRLHAGILLFALGVLSPAFAQSTAGSVPPPPSNVPLLAPVVVSGVVPGPGLWKVSKDGHVLWVLGTLSPLPRHMQWESRDLDRVIGQSQQVLLQPKIKLKADIGFFGKLFLLPAAYGARKNANGETLDQVMDATTYARWRVLKQKYLGSDRGIERWRPLFAAEKLYKKALKANGLSGSGGVPGTVKALAKRYGVQETAVDYRVEIKHPRDAIKAFKAAAPGDLECFSHTLDSIEHDLPEMTERANAWAIGDLATLRTLPDSHRRDVCVSAITRASFARQLGLDDVSERLEAAWLTAARTALAKDTSSFAMLPMSELLSPTGYLTKLQAQGYTVESPEQQGAIPAVTDGVSTPATAESTAAQ